MSYRSSDRSKGHRHSMDRGISSDREPEYNDNGIDVRDDTITTSRIGFHASREDSSSPVSIRERVISYSPVNFTRIVINNIDDNDCGRDDDDREDGEDQNGGVDDVDEASQDSQYSPRSTGPGHTDIGQYPISFNVQTINS